MLHRIEEGFSLVLRKDTFDDFFADRSQYVVRIVEMQVKRCAIDVRAPAQFDNLDV